MLHLDLGLPGQMSFENIIKHPYMLSITFTLGSHHNGVSYIPGSSRSCGSLEWQRAVPKLAAGFLVLWFISTIFITHTCVRETETVFECLWVSMCICD